jgi:transposase
VVAAYKEQNQAERGVAFLKTRYFLCRPCLLKVPGDMALLMIMLLSLLVYGIAERRMRACLWAKRNPA